MSGQDKHAPLKEMQVLHLQSLSPTADSLGGWDHSPVCSVMQSKSKSSDQYMPNLTK